MKKATTEDKIEILKAINENLAKFLLEFMKPKISTLAEKNPHAFVEYITQLWSHYQRLIYAYDFISDKIKKFSLSFNKMAMNHTGILKGEVIGPVAVMGSLQL